MPRGPRIDAPGLVHHLRARGIEGCRIFKNDYDRKDFLLRLSLICENQKGFVYAWALMPNHFHLAYRTGKTPLATSMRRLLTGFATGFNKRHKRQGHLFQNRYWSTVVDDEAYLLTLVRYIHRNPLRAGIVKTQKGLDKHPWTGHACLMGKAEWPWQDTDEILGRFGKTVGSARRKLSVFMGDHKAAEKDETRFKGGGLIRSVGGMEEALRTPKEERGLYDERVLGDGAFVESVLEQAEEQAPNVTLSIETQLQNYNDMRCRVCSNLDLSEKALFAGSHNKKIVTARCIVTYLAVRHIGIPGRTLAALLNTSPSTITRDIARGEERLESLRLSKDELLKG